MKLEKLSTLERGDEIMNFSERLNLFGLQVVPQPEKQQAVTLRGPTLQFEGSTVSPCNGSFNLLDRQWGRDSTPRIFAR